MAHRIERDEVSLLKSASIRFDRERVILLLMTYHVCKEEPKDGRFYRCDVCLKPLSEWREISSNILNTEPLKPFDFRMLGLDYPYRLWYARRSFTCSDFSHWLDRMMGETRLREINEFIVTEFSPKIELPWFRGPYLFPGETEGHDIGDLKALDLNQGKWMTCLKDSAPRRKRAV